MSQIVIDVDADVAERFSLYNEQAGEGVVTESWIQARAEMLGYKITFDKLEKPYSERLNALGGLLPLAIGDHIYQDVSSGLTLDIDGINPFTLESHYIRFGGEQDDTLVGYDLEDRLYGGGGIDTINGNGGNDYLEGGLGGDILDGGNGDDKLQGGAGDDTLTGGKGVFDVLEGGVGNDKYIFNTGDQQLFIRDPDMNGSLIIKSGSEETVLGSQITPIASDVPVYEDADKNQFVLNGSRLFITTADDEKIIVEDFTSGKLGITLPSDPVEPPETNNTILGDLGYQDFDPVADGIQTQTDSLGNRIQIPGQVEAQEDHLFGSEDADLIQSGTLNDLVEGKGGDDRIEGGGGTDILVGGAGDDRLYADSEADFAGAFNSDDTAAGNTRDWLTVATLSSTIPTEHRKERVGPLSFSDLKIVTTYCTKVP